MDPTHAPVHRSLPPLPQVPAWLRQPSETHSYTTVVLPKAAVAARPAAKRKNGLDAKALQRYNSQRRQKTAKPEVLLPFDSMPCVGSAYVQ